MGLRGSLPGLEGRKCAQCWGCPQLGVPVPVFWLLFHGRLPRGAHSPGSVAQGRDCFWDRHVSQVSPVGVGSETIAGTIKKGSTGATGQARCGPGAG